MKLSERIDCLRFICASLQDTDSRLEKQRIVNDIPNELREDFDYILEILDNQHPLGYTFIAEYNSEMSEENPLQELTFKQYIAPLWYPSRSSDFRRGACQAAMRLVPYFNDFIEPIVNRTLRLGIGKSVLGTNVTSPMLAKKFDPDKILFDSYGYYITEKLDGNRCIAMYQNGEWHFISRNGKPMNVTFDMSNLPTDYIYDGEVISPAQRKHSEAFEQAILNPYTYNKFVDTDTPSTVEFQQTSGLINSNTVNKNLVYSIFDIVNYGGNYYNRHLTLTQLIPKGNNVRILPVLQYCPNKNDLASTASKVLDFITANGGEGIMINLGSGEYTQARSNVLLKYKKVQTMDMKVIDIELGEGKYNMLVGALVCECTLPDGNKVSCKVGSGLTDDQRLQWVIHPDMIVGKIIEVAYFSLSKTGVSGNMKYSLRFPRLKTIRRDKTEASPF